MDLVGQDPPDPPTPSGRPDTVWAQAWRHDDDADYHRRVSVAEVSRREVLAANAAPAAPADLPPLIWARSTTVRHRRRTGPAQ
ncbi:hypothetical protein ACWEPC_00870 [Nonomuraea sp. NPDC004297]